MLINGCSDFFIVVHLLLHEGQQQLSGFLGFVGSFIILVALWNRDFWLAFRAKFSALKKRLSYAVIPNSDEMIELIPVLPKSSELPSVADMAKLLVKAFPKSDHPEAYTLLACQLLPKKLARLPTFLERRWLVENLYESLTDALQQVPPNQRLQVLRADLCETEIKQLSSDSLMLAIARYMQEHPDATPNTEMDWLDFNEVSKWSAMSRADLQNEASELLEQLERWDQFAKANHPDVWEDYRMRYIHIELNLSSAYSGIFPTAMGELAFFLDAVGASFDELHLF